MEEQLAKPETALLAKEIGFDEPCSHYCILDFQNFKFDGILHKNGLPDEYNSTNIFQFVKRSKQPHLASVPTQSLLQKYLREEYNCFVEVSLHGEEHNEWDVNPNNLLFGVTVDYYGKNFEQSRGETEDFNDYNFKSYEDALEKGLQNALKIIKNNSI